MTHHHTYRTMPASSAYREGWDRIFGQKSDGRQPEKINAPGRPTHGIQRHPARGIMGRDGT